jgi:hypothetical protein
MEVQGEVRKLEEFKGKTIVNIHSEFGKVYMRFSDDTFAVLEIYNNGEGFSNGSDEILPSRYGTGTTDGALVKIGVITQQDHDIAVTQRGLDFAKRIARQKQEDDKKSRKDHFNFEKED